MTEEGLIRKIENEAQKYEEFPDEIQEAKAIAHTISPNTPGAWRDIVKDMRKSISQRISKREYALNNIKKIDNDELREKFTELLANSRNIDSRRVRLHNFQNGETVLNGSMGWNTTLVVKRDTFEVEFVVNNNAPDHQDVYVLDKCLDKQRIFFVRGPIQNNFTHAYLFVRDNQGYVHYVSFECALHTQRGRDSIESIPIDKSVGIDESKRILYERLETSEVMMDEDTNKVFVLNSLKREILVIRDNVDDYKVIENNLSLCACNNNLQGDAKVRLIKDGNEYIYSIDAFCDCWNEGGGKTTKVEKVEDGDEYRLGYMSHSKRTNVDKEKNIDKIIREED